MKIIAWFAVLSFPILLKSQPTGKSIKKWERFEVMLNGTSKGNPYTEVQLSAIFTKGNLSIKVNGFYDGNGIYKLRFMPTEEGDWEYITYSNNKQLNRQKGNFKCIAVSPPNHGPVQVWNTYNFRYADGKLYYPFGTTVYAWTHQGQALQDETLQTLKASPFNKLRFCVFPKTYSYVEHEPESYAYETNSTSKAADGSVKHVFNFTKFNPTFFAALEKRIDDLKTAGIEADLIIFHPYDKGRWGFDSMGKQNDLLYIKYLTARLSSFRNIWWSMANEFDYIKSKPP